MTTEKRKAGDWEAVLTDDGRNAAETGWVPRHLPVPRGRAFSAEPPAKQQEKAVTSSTPKREDHARVALRSTRESLTGRGDDKGLLHSSGHAFIPVTVARASVPRTMALIKTLFHAVRDAGGEVELESRRHQHDRRSDALRTMLSSCTGIAQSCTAAMGEDLCGCVCGISQVEIIALMQSKDVASSTIRP